MFPPFPASPPNQLWDEFFNLDPIQKLLISRVYYKLLLDDSSPDIKVTAVWESELGLNLDNHRWNAALDLIHKCSTCARLTLIQLRYCLGNVKNTLNNNKCSSPHCHIWAPITTWPIHSQATRCSSFYLLGSETPSPSLLEIY